MMDTVFGEAYSDISMPGRLLIELPEDAVGVIVECESGAHYTSQTHGVACHHPVCEGVFAPLHTAHDVPHVGCWGVNIDADALDGWFQAQRLPVRVDRARIGKNMDRGWGEAWIPVRLPHGHIGIFTWENCD